MMKLFETPIFQDLDTLEQGRILKQRIMTDAGRLFIDHPAVGFFLNEVERILRHFPDGYYCEAEAFELRMLLDKSVGYTVGADFFAYPEPVDEYANGEAFRFEDDSILFVETLFGSMENVYKPDQLEGFFTLVKSYMPKYKKVNRVNEGEIGKMRQNAPERILWDIVTDMELVERFKKRPKMTYKAVEAYIERYKSDWMIKRATRIQAKNTGYKFFLKTTNIMYKYKEKVHCRGFASLKEVLKFLDVPEEKFT